MGFCVMRYAGERHAAAQGGAALAPVADGGKTDQYSAARLRSRYVARRESGHGRRAVRSNICVAATGNAAYRLREMKAGCGAAAGGTGWRASTLCSGLLYHHMADSRLCSAACGTAASVSPLQAHALVCGGMRGELNMPPAASLHRQVSSAA
jgi:hypothetical protein